VAAPLINVVRGLALAGLIVGAAQAGTPPRRVVSLNPCLDGILLEVADPGQITALSHYAREPGQSVITRAARRFPFTWGSAEEVVALRPDLVLNSGAGDIALTGALPRLHVREARFAVPASVEESLAQVRRMAVLVGHPERGDALAARIRAALAAAAPRPGEPRLGALIYQYHGLALGPHTLADDLMRRTGFDNRAARHGVKGAGEVPLEALIADPPQVLLAGRLAPDEPVWADRVLSNPVLGALPTRMRRETFPAVLMFCGGPSLIPASAALAEARENALRGLSR
jgi:iron complex transport system substrate-binding protein